MVHISPISEFQGIKFCKILKVTIYDIEQENFYQDQVIISKGFLAYKRNWAKVNIKYKNIKVQW